MSEYRIGELFSLETYDGNLLVFDGDVRLTAWGGLGMPSIDFQRRTGYKQHGSTEIDYTLNDRSLQLSIWHSPQTPRSDYWDMRARLHDFLRPNRGGPLVLTALLPDGNKRSIQVRADPGFAFNQENEKNNFGVDEGVTFIAFSPIWYDADGTTLDITASSSSALIFPITFPISFGTAGLLFATGNIIYGGTWESWPQIDITGPYSSVTITHNQLDVSIYLTVAVGATKTRSLRLTPGNPQLLDGSGVSKFAELGPGSNLVDFRLQPDPIISGGIQDLSIIVLGGTAGQTAVSVTYNERFIAL